MATLLADPLDVKELWFTNLLLLGFDRHAHESQYNIHFTRDMFSVPNQKGMEVVFHYLFSQLDQQQCYEEFRDCWPVFDKKQEQIFRKKCCIWLADIAKEDPASAISRSTGSLLLSPAGDRFYQLLELFSTYCVRAVLLREVTKIEKSVFIPQSIRSLGSASSLPEVRDHSTKLHTVRHIQHTTQRLNNMANLHEEWRQYSCSLVESYRRSLKHTKELEESLVSLKQHRRAQQQQTRGHTSPHKTAGSQLLDRRIKRVRQLWSHVDQFISDTSSQHEVVDSILQDGDSKLAIIGADLNTKVPEMLSSKLSEQDQPLTLVDEKGKVDLIELTKLWSAAIQSVTETLRANGLPDLSRDEEYIHDQLPVQLNSLAEIQNMRGALSLLSDKVEESIRERQAVLEPLRAATTQDGQDESPLQQERPPLITLPSLSIAPAEYQLLPPTPHKVTTPQSPPPTPYYMRPSFTKTVSTPDAVRSISQQIARASQHHHPPSSSIPVPSSAHPLAHSTTAARHPTSHRTTTPRKPPSHKKKRPQSTRKKTHTTRQTDQQASSQGVSSPSIPAAKTVFSPSEALAEHMADIVSGVRTTPISWLPSHLSSYTTPQSPTEAFVSRDKIQRTPLSPSRAPSTSEQHFSHSSPQPALTNSQRTTPLSSAQPSAPSQQVAPTPLSLRQRSPSSHHSSTPSTKSPVTPSLTYSPRRPPLSEHNHTDMFLSSSSSSFQLVDSDSDDSSDSPAINPSSSSPPIGLLINFRDSPLH